MRESTEGADRSWWRTFLILAATTTNIALFTKPTADFEPPPGMTLEELIKRHDKKQETCVMLKDKKDALQPRYFNRRAILDRLVVMGKCTDPEEPDFDLGPVCEAVIEGIRSNSPKWRHPILNPFYLMLYDNLKCAEHVPPNRVRMLGDLIAALESTDAIKNYRLLDPASPLDEKICREAIAFGNDAANQKHFGTIADYVIKKSPGIAPESPLGVMLKGVAAKAGGSSPAELKRYVESRIALATNVLAIPKFAALCAFSPMYVIQKYDSTLTEEEISAKRRRALPIVQQLLAMLKDEQDDEAKRVSNAIFGLAKAMSAPQRK